MIAFVIDGGLRDRRIDAAARGIVRAAVVPRSIAGPSRKCVFRFAIDDRLVGQAELGAVPLGIKSLAEGRSIRGNDRKVMLRAVMRDEGVADHRGDVVLNLAAVRPILPNGARRAVAEIS